jgi:hypothetical protein
MINTNVGEPKRLSTVYNQLKNKRLNEIAVKHRYITSLECKDEMIKTNEIILGVDPGEKGAIACVHRTTKQLLFSFNFPVHEQWGHQIVDLSRLKEMLSEHLLSSNIDYLSDKINVCVERVASYGQGSKSAFVFGCNSLGLLNWFLCEGFNLLPSANPNTWKQSFLLTNRPKSAATNLACQLFNDETTFYIANSASKNELIIGRADAALIALYASNCTIVSKKGK